MRSNGLSAIHTVDAFAASRFIIYLRALAVASLLALARLTLAKLAALRLRTILSRFRLISWTFANPPAMAKSEPGRCAR